MITAVRQTKAVSARLGAMIVAAQVVLVVMPSPRASGAAVAFDSAADPAYNLQPGQAAGWLQLSNGGYGFGPWAPASGNPNPTSPAGNLGSSTTNGTGDLDNDGDINTPRNANGRAWGFNVAAASVDQNGFISNPSAGVLRMLKGQLTVGQTFSVDFDNGFLANPLLPDGRHYSGVVQWGLENGGLAFDFIARADRPDYLFAGMDTGVPLTTEGIHCEFTIVGPNPLLGPPFQWMFKLTPLSPGAQTHVLTGTSNFDIRALPNEFSFADNAAGSDPANAVYINNLSITDVPEPGAVGVLGAGAALLLRRRRRAVMRRMAITRTGSNSGCAAPSAERATVSMQGQIESVRLFADELTRLQLADLYQLG